MCTGTYSVVWKINFNVETSVEIPNDAYTILSQFWLAVQYSVKSTASWLGYLENNENATLNSNMSYPLRYQYWWLFMVLNWYQRHKNLILHQNWVNTWYRGVRSVMMWNRPLGAQIRIYRQVWYWLNSKNNDFLIFLTDQILVVFKKFKMKD